MRPDATIFSAVLTFLPALAGAAPPPDSPVQAEPQIESVALEVKVLDEKNLPVHQATVRIFTQPHRILLTNSAGLVQTSELKPGKYRVNVGKAGYQLEERMVALGEEKVAKLEFRLKAEAPPPS